MTTVVVCKMKVLVFVLFCLSLSVQHFRAEITSLINFLVFGGDIALLC